MLKKHVTFNCEYSIDIYGFTLNFILIKTLNCEKCSISVSVMQKKVICVPGTVLLIKTMYPSNFWKFLTLVCAATVGAPDIDQPTKNKPNGDNQRGAK